MRRKLYIHAGAHRTATTTIQSFLRLNFEKLLEHGVLNPYGAGRHVVLFNDIFSGRAFVKDICADLDRRANSKGHVVHSIVLSDEDICMREDLSLLQRFTESFDVVLLFTMRRQDIWLESWHQQNIKWQWKPRLAHLTFSQFLKLRDEFHWIHYDRLTQRLSDLVGKDNVKLRVFEKSSMPLGPVKAFCDDISLPNTSSFDDPLPANSSLHPQVSEFSRMMPLDELPEKHRAMVERAIVKVNNDWAPKRRDSTNLLMDSKTRKEVLKEYTSGNVEVARRFFGRDELFFDEIPPDDSPIADQRLPSDSYDLMSTFVGPMLRELSNQIRELEDRIKRQPN